MFHKFTVVLAVLLLLGGCHKASAPAPIPSETAAPVPSATPSPEPTEEPEELWGFPIDETHDAFEVDTKGELGTVLVTVERGEPLYGPEADGYYQCTLSVWDESDLTTPIQTWEETMPEPGGGELMDANFDGHTDFLYTWNWMAVNWPFSLYIWDEEQGQFIHKADFMGRWVEIDEAEQVIEVYVHWTNVDGVSEIYRWENDELVCFRREEYSDGDHVTYELVDGEWQELSREPDPRLGV